MGHSRLAQSHGPAGDPVAHREKDSMRRARCSRLPTFGSKHILITQHCADEALITADLLLAAWQHVYTDFATLARTIADERRWDATYVDVLDDPPRSKSYGGTIAHVITHNMHHRAEIIHILTRLGLQNVLEGDVLSWEQQAHRP